MYHLDMILEQVVSSLAGLQRKCLRCKKLFVPNTNRMKVCTRCTGRKQVSHKRGHLDEYDP